MIKYFSKHRYRFMMGILLANFLLISIAFAQQPTIDTDLNNLKAVSPMLTVAYDKIDIFNAWEAAANNASLFIAVSIGILDSGVDLLDGRHPEFIGVDFSGSDSSAFRDVAPDEDKEEGHGTQVAGIIGANNISAMQSYEFPHMNGIISGVSDQYSLVLAPRPVIRTDIFSRILGFLPFFTSGFEKALKVMPQNSIINISFGHAKCSEVGNRKGCLADDEFDDVKMYYKEGLDAREDILFIMSAGNDGIDTQFHLPGGGIDKANTIAVGATKLNDVRASFSNHGGGVNIAAPGENIYAPAIRTKGNFPFTIPQDKRDYDSNFSGTSASAPMVTGVAGLLKAISPDLTPGEIKQILIETADPIKTGEPNKRIGTGCYDNPNDPEYTGCRLNALRAVCHALALDCAPPVEAPIWPMLQKDAQHSGLADVAGPPFASSAEVKVKWQKSLGLQTNFSPLIGAGGVVYVGAGSSLFALDGATGSQIWQAPVPGSVSSGAIGPDGTIYVCSNSSVQGTLSAFEPINGQQKWTLTIGGPRPCLDPVIGQNGIIYTAVPPPINAQTASVVAVNPNGTEKWRYQEPNIAASSPALSLDESQVYVALNNHLVAFSAQDGSIIWDRSAPIDNFLFSLAVTVDQEDRVLATTQRSLFDRGNLHAFSKSGNLLWSSPNIGVVIGSPALNRQGNIVIPSRNYRLFVLDKTDGSIISNISLSAFPETSHPAVDKNNLAYIGFSADGLSSLGITAIDLNSSSVKWFFPTFKRILSSPAISENTLYFTAQDTLFVLGE